MTVKSPKPYLLNIVSSVDAVISYTPVSEQELSGDPKSYDAILMRLQDTGENLIHIRDQFPEFWEEYSTDSWSSTVPVLL